MKKVLSKSECLIRLDDYLRQKECSRSTMAKYRHDASEFLDSVYNAGSSENELRQNIIEWKENLNKSPLKPSTVNVKIAAANAALSAAGFDSLRIRSISVQRPLFREEKNDLTKEDYFKLLDAALSTGKERLYLVMQTICSTGIRVGELKYITVRAASLGQAGISMKGKKRIILLPERLCCKLLDYAYMMGINDGEIFLTTSGKSLSRGQIWADMKKVAEAAEINPSKVYPHNLRHLFARSFYAMTKDTVLLADILGHSNVSTTRIYLISTGEEHKKELDKLGLLY